MTDTLVERLRKIAVNLRIQADMARRVAETYAPECEKWEQQKGDKFLTAMVRYQVDQEQQARTLSREADDTEAAAARITRPGNTEGGRMTNLNDLARRYPNEPMKKPIRAYRKTVQELVKRTFAIARGEQS